MSRLRDRTNVEGKKVEDSVPKLVTRSSRAKHVLPAVGEGTTWDGRDAVENRSERRSIESKTSRKEDEDKDTSNSTQGDSPNLGSANDGHGPSGLKVYERRAIYPLVEEGPTELKTTEKETDSKKDTGHAKEKHAPTRKKYSWVGRSLNRRSSISFSLKSLSLDERVDSGMRKSAEFRSPLRRSAIMPKKVEEEARKVYFEEINKYFAEIDAFELEQESPSPIVNHMRRSRLTEKLDTLHLGESISKPDNSNDGANQPSVGQQHNVKTDKLATSDDAQRRVRAIRMSSSSEPLDKNELASIRAGSRISVGGLNSKLMDSRLSHGMILQGGSITSNDTEQTSQTTFGRRSSRLSVELHVAEQDTDVLEGADNRHVDPTPFEQLLSICDQSSELPSMEDFLSQWVDIKHVKKIGEGTFGEAFKAKGVVFKIVPMEGDLKVNGEVQKDAADMLAEAAIATRLSKLHKDESQSEEAHTSLQSYTEGIIKTHAVGVCQGRYPKSLVKQWKKWDRKHHSENDCVDIFPSDQKYVVFVVDDGGQDLEHFDVQSFSEARSLLLQVSLALAVAEAECRFEHRDLHWGNILIRREECNAQKAKLDGTVLEYKTTGLRVSLIDFTLSRLDIANSGVAFCDLSSESWLFEGPEGDMQADTYRHMQKVTGGAWSGHHPQTNCLWLHYLADVLLYQKKVHMESKERKLLKSFKKRVVKYSCAVDAVWDELFSSSIIAV